MPIKLNFWVSEPPGSFCLPSTPSAGIPSLHHHTQLFKTRFIDYVSRCFVCTCVCVLSVCSAHRGQAPLELELQTAAGHHVGAGVWFSEKQPVLLTPQYIEIRLFVCLF